MTVLPWNGHVSSWSFFVSDAVDDFDRSFLILSKKKKADQNSWP